MKEGASLSVAARLWPGCKAFTVLGRWKNLREVTVFMWLTYVSNTYWLKPELGRPTNERIRE